MGKGRQSAPAEQTVVQSNLPKYVQPYFERLLERTEAESKREYEPFEGQRLAEASQDTLDARDRARQVAESGIAGLPAAQAATTAGVGRALQGMGFEAGQFDSGAAAQYMSPYMQQVVDVQKNERFWTLKDRGRVEPLKLYNRARLAAAEQQFKRPLLARRSTDSLQKYRLRGSNRHLSRHSNSLSETGPQERTQKE